MFLKDSAIDAGLVFKPGRVQLRKVTCIKGSLVMSCKCYNIAFKLRTVAVAEGKSTEAAVLDVRRISE